MRFLYIVIPLCLLSCTDIKKEEIASILKEWNQKEIIFPNNTVFTIQGSDTVDYTIRKDGYKIVTYVDSVGCTSCKLRLSDWTKFINDIDSLSSDSTQFLFFFFPKKRMEIYYTLKVERFKYPVCIDVQDDFNSLNHFPSSIMFHTFLIDKDNKVVAIGNPIHNPKVKELYLNIISGKKDLRKTNTSQTTASLSEVDIDMGEFDWNKKQEREITISNTGNGPLAISDVTTSCGCTTVEYTKEPIMPKKSGILKITYQAEHPEHFNKTVSIHCNTPTSPMQIKVTGSAK